MAKNKWEECDKPHKTESSQHPDSEKLIIR